MHPPERISPSDLQGNFGAALLAPEMPVPAGIVGPRGKKAEKRFAVYRNNVTVSLVTALGEIFPVVRKLVGENFFAAMARIYITRQLPASPMLFEYGQTFDAFLEAFEPVAKLVYLPGVATLERAWLDSFHAADAQPLDPVELACVAPEELGNLTFAAHPAARLVRSRYAIVSIFSASREDAPLNDIDAFEAENALVSRPGNWVEVRRLPPGAAEFYAILLEGGTLSEAAGQAVSVVPGFDLPAAIAAMLEAGIFIGCRVGSPHPRMKDRSMRS